MTVMKPTVNDVANTIKIDAADVGIAWDVISHQYDALDFVELKLYHSKILIWNEGAFFTFSNLT